MSSRKTKRTDVFDELFELLMSTPVWMGPIVAAVMFATFRWIVPWTFSPRDPNNPVSVTFGQTVHLISTAIAFPAGILVLVIWVCAEWHKAKNRKRLNQQTGIDSIRALPWQEFEQLLSEAFRRQGYFVEHTGKSGPDGGIDQRLVHDGKTTLVQCKHWHSHQVGVKIVRELYGVVASEHADAGIVVTSGIFTPDAIEFVRKVPMTLIDGDELVQMIGEVQKSAAIKPPLARAASEIPTCPECASVMVMRTARRGSYSGLQFWGCSRFPACAGKRQLSQ